MFIEFQFGNFRSFRDVQKLTMIAAPLHAHDGGLEEGNVFEAAGYRMLKTKAIYGANASGKSNIGRAFGSFKEMIIYSVSKEGLASQIWENRFHLLTEWDNEPITFQYVFTLSGVPFRYGFNLVNSNVANEWLYGKPGTTEVAYFTRTNGKLEIDEVHFAGAGAFMEQAISGENEVFRPDSLFLTGAALNGNKTAAAIRTEIANVANLYGITERNTFGLAKKILADKNPLQTIPLIELMKAADTGIEDLQLLEVPTNDEDEDRPLEQNTTNTISSKVMATHRRYDENGSLADTVLVDFLRWESEGTKQLLGVAAFVLESLKHGRTLFIDEFDARFHPNLTLKLVQLFNTAATNPMHSQLIFITHDTSLLRRANLRRDQIVIVNKDRYGMSSFKTLIEYKGVRKDASYEKEYQEGSYNGIPFLKGIDELIVQTLSRDGI